MFFPATVISPRWRNGMMAGCVLGAEAPGECPRRRHSPGAGRTKPTRKAQGFQRARCAEHDRCAFAARAVLVNIAAKSRTWRAAPMRSSHLVGAIALLAVVATSVGARAQDTLKQGTLKQDTLKVAIGQRGVYENSFFELGQGAGLFKK